MYERFIVLPHSRGSVVLDTKTMKGVGIYRNAYGKRSIEYAQAAANHLNSYAKRDTFLVTR